MKNNRAIRYSLIFLGPCLFIAGYFISIYFSMSHRASMVIGIAMWMILWWSTEVINLAVTALLPIVLFDVFSIIPLKETTYLYGSPVVFLFMGGFIIALAMQKTNLHKRIALSILKIIGHTPTTIIMGFMIVTFFLSMWISNTATTAMMFPIAISVITLLGESKTYHNSTREWDNFVVCLLLGIAYSANIGGISTIVGTPPNLILLGILQENYDIHIGFFQWIVICLPIAIVLITITYIYLINFYSIKNKKIVTISNILEEEIKKIGSITHDEKIVLGVFVSTIFLWMTKSNINSINPYFKLSDTSIIIMSSILLFVLPSNKKFYILSWNDMKQLPWGILLLFGGGLSLAGAIVDTKIVDYIGQNLMISNNLSFISIAILIAIVLFSTEIMSNIALISVCIPVISSILLQSSIPLIPIVVPMTIVSSCAFMFPISTPPNSIVFASGKIKVIQMAKTGLGLNIIVLLIISVVAKIFLSLY